MTIIRKAVIPAAGLGTRFLPATKALPKEMVPVVDKPAIQYVVEEAVAAGIRDILIITGRGKRAIEDHFDRAFELEHELEMKGKTELLAEVRSIADMADIHYLRQGDPLGLGHAVGVARRHVGDEPFAVMLGDDIMHPGSTVLASMMDAYDTNGRSVVALQQVAKQAISQYGCAAVDPGPGPLVHLNAIVEKPDPAEAPSDLAVMGRYVFGPEIFDAIEQVAPGIGGEIQLTDAIAGLIGGPGVDGWVFSSGRFDIGNRLDWLRASVALALEDPELGAPFRAYLEDVVRGEQ